MPSDTLIEQRLSAVEDAVAEIQRRLGGEAPATDWVERFIGSFKEEPAFADGIASGRAFRSADRRQEGDGA